MRYLVTIRGIAEQIVEVEADSKSEARKKADNLEVEDMQEIDFVHGIPTWPAKTPVKEYS